MRPYEPTPTHTFMAVLLILLAVIAFSLLYSLVIFPAQQQKQLDECLRSAERIRGLSAPERARTECFERYSPR